jgi:hypothetical protein
MKQCLFNPFRDFEQLKETFAKLKMCGNFKAEEILIPEQPSGNKEIKKPVAQKSSSV